MQYDNFNSLSHTKELFKTNHKSVKKLPSIALLSNKLKINFPFLSPVSHKTKNEECEEKFWTERRKKYKTLEVERESWEGKNKMLENNEKIRNKSLAFEENVVKNSVVKYRINEFESESPEGKFVGFEEQAYQRESQKLKRRLRNLEQIQSKLFHRIQSLNYEEGSRTELKNPHQTSVSSNHFLPSIKTKEKEIRVKKGEEKTVRSINEMMITFSAGGKEWNKREADKSSEEIEKVKRFEHKDIGI